MHVATKHSTVKFGYNEHSGTMEVCSLHITVKSCNREVTVHTFFIKLYCYFQNCTQYEKCMNIFVLSIYLLLLLNKKPTILATSH